MKKMATEVVLTEDDRCMLEQWVRSGTTEQRLVRRARIILAAGAGQGTNEIARKLVTRPATVSQWRIRFARQGIAGLQDAKRPGKPPRYGETAEKRILAQLDETPPESYATWSGSLLGQALGIHKRKVWRVLSKHGIQLQRRRSWCISTDPEFARKAAEVVGLYLDPPENAVVLSVDEKPHIQALERAQGYLKLPNGKAVTGFSHEYKRHGTTTLFAALNIATGQVQAGHYQRRRRVEFLDFMDSVLAHHPGQELHLILDNLNTHKPKHDTWLASHPNVHFHFTPTHASWLNQIECWFSILSRRALKGASFTSPQQVREAIDAFIAAHNKNAAPFQWTKANVFPTAPKRHYADL